jgi:hypothetical protein
MNNVSGVCNNWGQVRRLSISVSLMASLLALLFTAFAYAQTAPDNGVSQDFIQQIVEVVRLQERGDAAVLDGLREINRQLTASGKNFAVGTIKFFTIGKARPDIRLLQYDTRWVPGDERRNAQGKAITCFGPYTASPAPLSYSEAQQAITQAMSTWGQDRSLEKLPLLFGFYPTGLGYLGLGFLADINHFGWVQLDEGVLGLTIIAYFIDPATGQPTDINRDQYSDTAWTLTLYNSMYQWGIDVELPSVDFETVALHENGHAIGTGHFGPPPVAVMNPAYTGIKHSLYPIDSAGMFTLFGSWPNR